MMIDDLLFLIPNECDECHCSKDVGSMIWVNGVCVCPACYNAHHLDDDLLLRKGA